MKTGELEMLPKGRKGIRVRKELPQKRHFAHSKTDWGIARIRDMLEKAGEDIDAAVRGTMVAEEDGTIHGAYEIPESFLGYLSKGADNRREIALYEQEFEGEPLRRYDPQATKTHLLAKGLGTVRLTEKKQRKKK